MDRKNIYRQMDRTFTHSWIEHTLTDRWLENIQIYVQKTYIQIDVQKIQNIYNKKRQLPWNFNCILRPFITDLITES